MRMTPLFLGMLLFAACSEEVRFADLTLEQAMAEAQQTEKKILIDFWADG